MTINGIRDFGMKDVVEQANQKRNERIHARLFGEPPVLLAKEMMIPSTEAEQKLKAIDDDLLYAIVTGDILQLFDETKQACSKKCFCSTELPKRGIYVPTVPDERSLSYEEELVKTAQVRETWNVMLSFQISLLESKSPFFVDAILAFATSVPKEPLEPKVYRARPRFLVYRFNNTMSCDLEDVKKALTQYVNHCFETF